MFHLANRMFQVQCFLLLCIIVLIIKTEPIKDSIEKENEAQILSNEYIIDEDGNYRFSFKTSNGITRSETGTIIDKGLPNEHVIVQGRYTYFNTNGEEEFVQYIADKSGYRLSIPQTIVVQSLPSSVVASLLG